MSKRPVLCVIALFFSLISNNTSAKEGVQLLGNPTCGSWVKGNFGTQNKHWVIGYLSGIAAATEKDVFKDKPDLDGLMIWIGNYCQKNPLNFVDQAADELAKELLKKSGQ